MTCIRHNTHTYTETTIQFADQANHDKARQAMRNLEGRLKEIGFTQYAPREHKWEHSRFIHIDLELGRPVKVETYYSGGKQPIRQAQSVCYDISGLQPDVDRVIQTLNNEYHQN